MLIFTTLWIDTVINEVKITSGFRGNYIAFDKSSYDQAISGDEVSFLSSILIPNIDAQNWSFQLAYRLCSGKKATYPGKRQRTWPIKISRKRCWKWFRLFRVLRIKRGPPILWYSQTLWMVGYASRSMEHACTVTLKGQRRVWVWGMGWLVKGWDIMSLASQVIIRLWWRSRERLAVAKGQWIIRSIWRCRGALRGVAALGGCHTTRM